MYDNNIIKLWNGKLMGLGVVSVLFDLFVINPAFLRIISETVYNPN